MPMKLIYRLLLVVILFSLSACQTTNIRVESQEMDTIIINDSTHMSYAPIFLAEAEGYFEEVGIRLEKIPFNSVAEAIPLLLSGDIDVYAGSNSPGLLNILREEPAVKIVAQRGAVLADNCTYLAILVRKDLFDSGEVTGPADLEGRKVDVSVTGTTGYTLSQYLAPAGFTLEDIDSNQMPPSAYIDAFRNQTVDVLVTLEFSLTRLLQDGNAVVLARAEDLVSPFLTSVLGYGKRLMVDDPDLGTRFMVAYLRGVEKYNEGATEENLKIISEISGEDVELLRTACWIPIPLDPQIDFKAVEPFQNWLLEQGHLDILVTEEQFWDPRFLEAASSLLEDTE
jgi:ABC-type nitrate/sulfonate/bicarbonate transport system substrate-binding protein